MIVLAGGPGCRKGRALMNGIHAYREAPERPEPFHDASPQQKALAMNQAEDTQKKVTMLMP